MKPRLIFLSAFFLAIMPYDAVAQPARTSVDVEPPRLEKILANATSQPNEALAELVTVKPEIPLGPPDMLKEYESEMALVAQRMSAEVVNILQAQGANQITREQAEYLIQERYQVAMMQHQVLSALHDTLERDMALAAKHTKGFGKFGDSGTAVVVELPSSESSEGCK